MLAGLGAFDQIIPALLRIGGCILVVLDATQFHAASRGTGGQSELIYKFIAY